MDAPITLDEYNESPSHMQYWGGVKKAYCLPEDFFEDHKAPYQYFKVEDLIKGESNV